LILISVFNPRDLYYRGFKKNKKIIIIIIIIDVVERGLGPLVIPVVLSFSFV